MFKHGFVLMAPVGEDSGFGALDRGDSIPLSPPLDEAGTQDEVISDEAAAAEELVEKVAEEVEAEEADEKPRDETGKFTKKTREVPAHVPKSRMDEAVTRERTAREAAEGRLKELEAQLKTVDRNADIDKLEKEIVSLEQQHTKLLLDGEAEKAATVMGDIRRKERQIGISSNSALSEQAKDEAREEMRMELAIERLEGTYDEFNPAHENFDEGLVEMVVAMQARKISQGLSPSKALVSAANEVMTRISSDGGKGDTRGLAAAAKGSGRKAEQVAKNLDTARRQPASTRVAGKDSDKGGEPVAWNGTREEFNALPDSTKAKLRGDFI